MEPNVYKGLIIKELCTLKSYKRNLIFFILIFVFFGFVNNQITALPIFMLLGFGMIGLSTFSYDELARSDKYILSLPLTRKQIVISRYLIIAIFNLVGVILGFFIGIIGLYIKNGTFTGIGELIVCAVCGLFGLGIVQMLQIPINYKYGREKARIYLYIIIACVTLIISGVFLLINRFNLQYIFEDVTKSLDFLGIPIIILLTVLGYYLSYKVSYRIYREKEI